MPRTRLFFMILLALLVLGGCSSDDPAGPVDDNNDDPGGSYNVAFLPFEVVRHGITPSDVWTDGEVVVTVASKGLAFVQSDAGRFILPVHESFHALLNSVSSTGAGKTYVTGSMFYGVDPPSPLIVRFEDGMGHVETVDTDNPGTSVTCTSSSMTYLTVGQELWAGIDGSWTLQHEFPDMCTDFFHGGTSSIYVSCNDGLYSYEGLAWENVYPTGSWMTDVEGLDEDQVMAVAGQEIIVRDGGADFEVAYNAGVLLTDIDWAAESWAVAVGFDGVVVMYDGINWSRIQVDFPWNLTAVKAWKEDGQSRAIAVGYRGAEYRYADGDWTGSYLPEGYWQDLAGDGQGNLFALFTNELQDEPDRTLLFTYDGSDWEKEPGPTGILLSRMFVRNAQSIWAIGLMGDMDNFIARYDGSDWYTTWLSTLEMARDLWVSNESHSYVACDLGTVFVDGAPETAITPPQNLTGIWGVSDEDVFVVGENGTICRRQEGVWTPMISGTAAHLNGIAGHSADHVVAVGDDGAVMRFDGNVWTDMNSGLDADLDQVWTDGAQNIWVATSVDDLVAHYDGSGWEVYQTDALQGGPRAVWSDGQDVWVSVRSYLLRYAEPPSFTDILGMP